MNQKGFMKITIIILFIVALTIAGYFTWSNNWSQTLIADEPMTNWQFVDADSFTLSLPPRWKFNKLRGIDSYVGEFVGDGVKLSFDYGWYSNSLAEDNDPDHIVTYETIDGYKAKIVVPKVTGKGMTGVYFSDLGGEEFEKTLLEIHGRNLNELRQQTALKIFRTIKIVK